MLETYACQRAADNIGEEQLDQLRQLERSESEALAKEDLERISEINSAIHELILESSGNDVLMDLIGYLQARVPSYRLFALGNEENLQAFSRSHGRIISLLEQGEGSKAGEEMSRHVKLAKDVMLQALEERQTN